jgi:hypothetical protein
MIRDMEELLNSVYDTETKDYLKEALNCYNSGSYRASVIMSVISGVYDLHKKVKSLASVDKKCRKLDEDIEKIKEELKAYEKTLIERCASKDIDMLNSNDSEELIRCLTTRHACAHPSNFVCTAEKARDIFSSIIDIIASKPSLYSYAHMNIILEKLEEKTFFPTDDKEKNKKIVSGELDRFQKVAISPFLKKVSEEILKTNNNTQRDNLIEFLSLSSDYCKSDFEKYMDDFFKDENEMYLNRLIDSNVDILGNFSNYNIEKIISKLKANISYTKEVKIKDPIVWKKIVLSPYLQKKDFIDNLIESIIIINKDQSVKIDYSFLFDILKDENCSSEFKILLEERLVSIFSRLEAKDIRESLEIVKMIDNSDLANNLASSLTDMFNKKGEIREYYTPLFELVYKVLVEGGFSINLEDAIRDRFIEISNNIDFGDFAPDLYLFNIVKKINNIELYNIWFSKVIHSLSGPFVRSNPAAIFFLQMRESNWLNIIDDGLKKEFVKVCKDCKDSESYEVMNIVNTLKDKHPELVSLT